MPKEHDTVTVTFSDGSQETFLIQDIYDGPAPGDPALRLNKLTLWRSGGRMEDKKE